MQAYVFRCGEGCSAIWSIAWLVAEDKTREQTLWNVEMDGRFEEKGGEMVGRRNMAFHDSAP